MCQIILFTNIHCKCQWGEITLPCGPGMGFSTCGQLSSGIAQREPATYKSGYKLCPEHGWQGMYDRNMVRMVVEVKTGRKWGKGPSIQDAGCDINNIDRRSTTHIPHDFGYSPSESFISEGWQTTAIGSLLQQKYSEINFEQTNSPNMLPTPDTSHVPYERVYEPAEDSYLLLDTLSAPSETAFLQSRFGPQQNGGAPLVLEVGPGSGVVIAFVVAQSQLLFGTRDVLAAAVDVNSFACAATNATVKTSQAEEKDTAARCWLGSVRGDLVGPLRNGCVDVLVFNPPYVPSEELPVPPATWSDRDASAGGDTARKPTFDEDSYLLALSYAGGIDGMETTNRLLDSLPETLSARGCAYVLLCARNKPEEVKQRVMAMGPEWRALTVGDSGKKAGWEKLQIVRIWRENAPDV